MAEDFLHVLKYVFATLHMLSQELNVPARTVSFGEVGILMDGALEAAASRRLTCRAS